MPAHLVRVVDASQREDLVIGRTGRARVGHAVVARHVGDEGDAQPFEVIAGEELEERVEGGLRQHDFGRPVADSPAVHGVILVLGQAVSVRALHAEHAALVAQVGAIVPVGAGEALQLWAVKRAEFQRVQAGVLGGADAQRTGGQVVGDSQDPSRRVDVRGNGDAAGLVDDLVGFEECLGARHSRRSQAHLLVWHAKLMQHRLEARDAGLAAWRKDAQGVGTETAGKLKSRQNSDFL